MAHIHIIQEGYSHMVDERMTANATCLLIVTPRNNIIVDTLTYWDGDVIRNKLEELGVTKIDWVISTHGHPDHTGNNHLFLDAKHIVGYSIFHRNMYEMHPFDKGLEYIIDDCVKVVPTPGHTSEDISVLIKDKRGKLVAATGDLFEREEDVIEDPNLWMDNSYDTRLQAENRFKILTSVDEVIPGHGASFPVTASHREAAKVFYDNL